MSLGIKETKEGLIAANEIAVLIISRFKNGIQLEDFEAFYEKLTNDAVFKAQLQAGWDNYKAIPAEIKDVDVNEGVELAMVQLSYLTRLLGALKKQVASEDKPVHPIGS